MFERIGLNVSQELSSTPIDSELPASASPDSAQQPSAETDLQYASSSSLWDSQSIFWFFSLVVHLALIFGFTYIVIEEPARKLAVEIFSEPLVEEEIEEVPEEFHFSNQVPDQIGAHSENGESMAASQAMVLDVLSEIAKPSDLPDREVGEIELNDTIQVSTGLTVDSLPVKGHAGTGVAGAEGAIDRLTHEILMSLEERKTLVVWLFDQSGSLNRQRAEILDRFDRIYEELNLIEDSGNQAFENDDESEPALLSSIVAFGSNVTLLTKQPTEDVSELKNAIGSIQTDESGVENVFKAVYMAAQEYQGLRKVSRRTKEPERNVMIVVVSDEAGDDQNGLDPTVNFCRKLEIPVYVVGVPAPFGRAETLVKWVDPDPQYDQTPQWGRVSQGPESLAPERIKLSFSGEPEDAAPIDSGFGPFALTRLCVETGGVYFTVHPNRNTRRNVSQRETEAFSAYIKRFFDPQTMRRYRPDYVSAEEYWRGVSSNKVRSSLLQAAQRSWVAQLEPPQLRFEKLDEARFVNEVTQAQRAAALLEPKVNELYTILKIGEPDRIRETSPRWQAGFDLAMGRVLAVKARTEAYNTMLAQAKQGLRFEKEKSNTWTLVPSDEINGGSRVKRTADEAREYLERVITDHAGTPWALLAQRELDMELGWTWEEDYTAPPPPPMPRRVVNNPPPPPNPATPSDERARTIQRPKERRQPPKL